MYYIYKSYYICYIYISYVYITDFGSKIHVLSSPNREQSQWIWECLQPKNDPPGCTPRKYP